jgi:hypothetical protein
MVGPSGFVERYKGKYTADQNATRVAGIPMYGSATQQSTTIGAGAASTVTVGAVTVVRVITPTTNCFVRLPPITFIAQPIAIEISGVTATSTTNVWITTNGVGTFNGTTVNTIKSTANATIELQATSSVNWAVMGTFSTGAYTGSTST